MRSWRDNVDKNVETRDNQNKTGKESDSEETD